MIYPAAKSYSKVPGILQHGPSSLKLHAPFIFNFKSQTDNRNDEGAPFSEIACEGK
jgi:hypothetical protein